MDRDRLIAAFKKKGYEVSFFASCEEARTYLGGLFCGSTIGFGDSLTLAELKLYDLLKEDNTVFDPNQCADNESFLATARQALLADYFFTSVNAATEDGVMVNLDGSGNRVAGSLFGHKKVFFVLGSNKLCSGLEEATRRTREIAAPANARRLQTKTPCALGTGTCQDCNSPERICNALVIYFRRLLDTEAEVIIIDETLGL